MKTNKLTIKILHFRKSQIEQEENEVAFFLLSFSDLSHHHACRSARGGSLSTMQFTIILHQGRISTQFQFVIVHSRGKYTTAGDTPISQSSIGMLPSIESTDTTLPQVSKLRFNLLPTFPDAHPYPTAKPFVDPFQIALHIC